MENNFFKDNKSEFEFIKQNMSQNPIGNKALLINQNSQLSNSNLQGGNNNVYSQQDKINQMQQNISNIISQYMQQNNEQFNELSKNGTKNGFNWLSVFKDQYQVEFDIQGGQNFGKSKAGWVWYKNLTIPVLSISLSRKDLDITMSEQVYANIYCMKKLRCQNFSQVKLLEDNQQVFIDGVVNFKSLKFTETTLMSRSNYFILVIYITNAEGKIYGIKVSQPFQVDGRRKYWMERESIGQVMLPFRPEKLERNFEKVDKKENQVTQIGEDLKSLFDYYSSQTIRRKIRHPLFLLLRFPEAVRFFINTNIIQATDNATLIKSIHNQIDNSLKLQANQPDINLNMEDKPLLLQLNANQSDKVQQQLSNKMAKYLYIIDSTACHYQSYIGQVPEYFKEIQFSYELKDQYKKVHYTLTPFKGVDEDLDMSEFGDISADINLQQQNSTNNNNDENSPKHQGQSKSKSATNLGYQGQQQQQNYDYRKEEDDQSFISQFQTNNNGNNNNNQINPDLFNMQLGNQDKNGQKRDFQPPQQGTNQMSFSFMGSSYNNKPLNNSYYSFKMQNSTNLQQLLGKSLQPQENQYQNQTLMNNSYYSQQNDFNIDMDPSIQIHQQSQSQAQNQQVEQNDSQQYNQTQDFPANLQNILKQSYPQENNNNNDESKQQYLQQQQALMKQSYTSNHANNNNQLILQKLQNQQLLQQQQQQQNFKPHQQSDKLCYFCQQHYYEQNQRYLQQNNNKLPSYMIPEDRKYTNKAPEKRSNSQQLLEEQQYLQQKKIQLEQQLQQNKSQQLSINNGIYNSLLQQSNNNNNQKDKNQNENQDKNNNNNEDKVIITSSRNNQPSFQPEVQQPVPGNNQPESSFNYDLKIE